MKRLLLSLGLVVACIIIVGPAAAQVSLSNSEASQVQRNLKLLGYDIGTVDGQIGPKTRDAIRDFQADSALAVTGRADAKLLEAVTAAANGFAQGLSVGFDVLTDHDLPYGDYRSGMEQIDLRDIPLSTCLDQCRFEQRCQSFTYNSEARVCFLKETVPQRVGFRGAVSGIKQVAEEQVAPLPRTAQAAVADTAPADTTDTHFTIVADGSDGLTPVQLWLKDGRPVLHGRWQPRTDRDAAFDYSLQEAALRRWIDLLLLADTPEVAEETVALQMLAAENLDQEAHARMLVGCEFTLVRAAYCRLRADDEFEVRRLSLEIAQHVPALVQTASQLPRELVYVELARLEEYDPARGALSVTLSEQSTGFIMTSDSLFGYGMQITAQRPKPPREFVWSAPAVEIEAAVQRVDASRYVSLAWTYRITDIAVPPNQFSLRELVLEPLSVAVYSDSLLTDKLADLALDGSALLAPEAVAQQASPAPAVPAAFEAHPFTLPQPWIIHLGVITPDKELQRQLNLLIVGQMPELASQPANALKLAHQNLIGVTRPETGTDWAGTNEFERARSQAAFLQGGPQQIVAMAPPLPQEVVLAQPATLAAYDFDAKRFPITYERDWDPASTEPLLVQNFFNENVLGSVHVQVQNGQFPDSWEVPEDGAQAELQRYLQLAGSANGKARRIWMAATVRLTELKIGDQDRAIFLGDLVKLTLHANRKLEAPVADIPVDGGVATQPSMAANPPPAAVPLPAAPPQDAAALTALCTVDAFAGTYDSQYGEIACRPSGDGLDCCYGGTCTQTIQLQLADDGKKLVGLWKDASNEGYAEFSAGNACTLADGKWAWETDPVEAGLYGWSVSGRKP